MKRTTNFVIYFLSLFFLTLPQHALAQALNGELDLTGQSLSQLDELQLNGQWGFVWNRLLSPEINLSEVGQTDVFYKEYPFYWNELKKDNQNLPAKGFGTYFLTINSPEDVDFQYRLVPLLTAYNVYLNGQLIAKNGEVGNIENHVPHFHLRIVPFKLKKGKNQLIIQVSNYNHRYGGAFKPFKVNEQRYVLRSTAKTIGIEMLLIGVFLIMSLYHLALYLLRPKDTSLLYFGIFAAVIALRIFSTGTDLLAYLFPSFSWEVNHKIDYLTFYSAVPLFLLFLAAIFPNLFHRKVVGLIQIITGMAIGLVVVTPASVYVYSIDFFQIFAIAVILYVLVIFFVALLKKQKDVPIIFGGVFVLTLTAIHDMLLFNGAIQSVEIEGAGMLVFVLSQSFVLSKQFTHAFNKNEELTQELNYKSKHLEIIT